jgi:hypothetical protein
MRALRYWEGGAEGSTAGTWQPVGRLDARRRQEAAELTVGARCPVCRRVLVARMGRRGPTFVCGCPGAREA